MNNTSYIVLLAQASRGRGAPSIEDASIIELLAFGGVVTVLALIAALLVIAVLKSVRRSRVRADGERATAVVIALARAPGKGSRQTPGARLTLRVEPAGRAPYEAVVVEGVHPLHAPRVQPGQRVPVIVDRGDPSMVLLDLDRR